MLVKHQVQLSQERDAEWNAKFAQDANWKISIDGKLQTILTLLGHSPVALQTGTSQTIAANSYGPYFGQCLVITSQLRGIAFY